MKTITKRTGIALAALAAIAPSAALADGIKFECNQYSGECVVLDCRDLPTGPTLPGMEETIGGGGTVEVCSPIGTFTP